MKNLYNRLKAFVIAIFSKFTKKKKNYKFFKVLFDILSYLVIVLAYVIYYGLWFGVLFIPYWILIFPIIHLVVMLVVKIAHLKYLKRVRANTIIYGGRGSGKGLLFQFAINSEKRAMSNIPYGDNVEVVNPKEYFGSIEPNTALKFLNEKTDKVKKVNKWENVPYFADDSTLFFPNYLDGELKKLYPQISLFLPIQRHLYNSYSVFNAQSIDRIFIQVRELQLDGYIKALKSYGKGRIWRNVPILKKYMFVKYRYYENKDSALGGLLPFEKLGIAQRVTSPLYMTNAGATREQYEATNGRISDGYIWIKRKNIYYDTRYYHKVFFGRKALSV